MTSIPRMTAAEMRRINKAQRDRGTGPGSVCPATSDDSDSTLIAYGQRGYRAPKLTRNGKPFDPAPGEIGSWVKVFRRGDGPTVGQVWSLGYTRGDVWVATGDVFVLASARHLESADPPAVQLAFA